MWIVVSLCEPHGAAPSHLFPGVIIGNWASSIHLAVGGRCYKWLAAVYYSQLSLVLKEERTIELFSPREILESQMRGIIAPSPGLRQWGRKGLSNMILHCVFQGIRWFFITNKLVIYTIHSNKYLGISILLLNFMKALRSLLLYFPYVLYIFSSHSNWYLKGSHYNCSDVLRDYFFHP